MVSAFKPHWSLSATLVLLGTGLFLVTILLFAGSLVPATRGSEIQTWEIRLDFTPMHDPTSTVVLLRGDGEARALRYARYRLVVVAAYEGSLPTIEAEQLLATTRKPLFGQALKRESFMGKGLTQGDQFHLWLNRDGSAAGQVYGFVSEAPLIVRKLAEDLEKLPERFDKIALADAYVKSVPIAEKRLQRLRDTGKTQFAPLNEFSADIQPVLERAIDNAGDFIALSQAHYDRLFAQNSRGHEFYVLRDGTGYQLTLFKAE